MADHSFKLTYATMFNPPEELHDRFDRALARTRDHLGAEYGMLINGKEHFTAEKFDDRFPGNTDVLLGVFQKGKAADANLAVSAAKEAYPKWSHTPWKERVHLLRKAADLMDERIFEIGVAIALEVGKNRMEALGDIAETADLVRYSCDRMEANHGFVAEMGRDPLVGFISTNVSVLRPYGVWLVISPFNFPAALTGGPAGAALVTGNTIVIKPATDTPWTSRLLAECFYDAGIPDGVVNYVTGGGATLGQALIDHPDVAGITFTGSFDVGMKIGRDFASGKWVRPSILELGGKNPTIVSKDADLDTAALGIVRSAFGLQGQKCSACSRVFIQKPVYEPLLAKIIDLASKLKLGDPTDRQINNGPVVNKASYQDYQNFCADLEKAGKIVLGGKICTDGTYAKGYYCENTIVVDTPESHPLWQQEMFLPITMIAPFDTLDEAMGRANYVMYGLTAGFYGSDEETNWFFDQIEAGVTYANRPQGATTGAWPGFQPFGGWKGSGSTGKNAGGLYYLPLYMHEQIRTLVKKN
jgi:1-pyrroline-5-carboxylate dehydrogenase